MADIAVPVAGGPILDTWGAAVANRLNQLQPISLSADFSTNATSGVEVPDWTIDVVSGRVYILQLFGQYQMAHVNQGIQLEVDLEMAGSVLFLDLEIWGQGSATGIARYRSFDGSLTGATTVDSTNNREFYAYAQVKPTADGELYIKAARGGSNTTSPGLTIREGSGGLYVVSL